MKATIEKSIGNTYLIKSGGEYHDLVFWKTAMRMVNKTNVLPELNELLATPHKTEVKVKKWDLDKLTNLRRKSINWIDKRRSIGEIIDLGIQKRIIKIRPYAFELKKGKVGFSELENPVVNYYVVINGFELSLPKYIFNYLDGNVDIIQQRSA